MKLVQRSGPAARRAAVALMLLAVLLAGTGLYFMWVRPAFLPEDLRYTGLTPATTPEPLSRWLRIVFATWGGFMTGFGIVLAGIAGTLFTGRATTLHISVVAALAIAFGRFLYSNVILRSDFLWFIGLLAGLAAIASVLLLAARQPGGEEGP